MHLSLLNRPSARPIALCIAGFGMLALVAASPATANEIGGNFAWQFRTPAERAVALQTLDLLARQRAGAFRQESYFFQNTYVAGDQVNCSVAANAVGNTGTTTSSGSASSPSVGNTPSIFAQATGSSVAAQGFPAAGGGSLSAPLNSTQSNVSSPQSAGVTGTTSSVGVNGLSASSGQVTQALNSTQANTGSPQNASVAGSTACGQAGSRR